MASWHKHVILLISSARSIVTRRSHLTFDELIAINRLQERQSRNGKGRGGEGRGGEGREGEAFHTAW